MKKKLLKFFLSLTIIFPTFTFAAGSTTCTGNDIGTLICNIQNILNSVIPVLIALGVVYFVWNVVQYVIGDNEEAKKKGRDGMIFGITGLAVIVGLWGLVNIVVNTFSLSNSSAPSIALIPGTGFNSNSSSNTNPVNNNFNLGYAVNSTFGNNPTPGAGPVLIFNPTTGGISYPGGDTSVNSNSSNNPISNNLGTVINNNGLTVGTLSTRGLTTAVASAPRERPSGAAATLSQASIPITKTITIKGVDYNVTYSYLDDGEVSASFTYTYPNKDSYTNNLKISFPVSAQGTHQYIYQGGQEGLISSGGSSVQVLNPGNDCNNFNGFAGCIEGDPDFTSLIASIKSGAPVNQFPPGLTFNTPPSTATGTFLMSGQYPVTVTNDTNGNILSVQSVNATGFGSGMYYYNLGGGYYVQTTDGTHYLLQGGPSGYIIVMQNFSVKNSRGVPTSVTGKLSTETPTQLSKVGYAGLSAPGNSVTFSVGATTSNDTVKTAIANLTNSSTQSNPTQGVLGGSSPSGYLSSLISSLQNAGYKITKTTDSLGEVVGMVSNNGKPVLYFSLGNDNNLAKVAGASSTSGQFGSECFVRNPEDNGNPISTMVAPDGTIPHISGNFKVVVDQSTFTDPAVLSFYPNTTAQDISSDIIANFLKAYNPYMQVPGLPQPISNSSTDPDSIVIISFANMADPSIAAQTLVFMPSLGLSGYIPSGSTDLILNALKNGKNVAIVTYNTTSTNGWTGDYFFCTTEHEMGHSLGAGEDYANGDSPMRNTCNPPIIGLNQDFAKHVQDIQQGQPLALVGTCGAGFQSPSPSSGSQQPYSFQFTNSGGFFVPIFLNSTTNQWVMSGTCNDAQLANGAYNLAGLPAGCYQASQDSNGYPTIISSDACTDKQVASGGINMSEGCYQPATTVDSSFIPMVNFSDTGKPGSCFDNYGQEYACMTTNCGGAGQFACPANTPSGTCLDTSGNSVTCPGVEGIPPPISTPPPIEGGYECSSDGSGSCVYNVDGGPYSDSTCDYMCGE